MENEIKALLKDDEQLLWCGKPEPFVTNDAEYKGKLRASLIFWAIICLIIEACYLSIVSSVEQSANLFIVIGIIAICGLFILFRLSDAGRVRKLVYALTDKNIILKGSTTKICPYSSIKYCDFETDKAGTTSLICGAQTDHIGREIDPRLLTIICMSRGAKGDVLADSLAMYSLSKDAIAILKERLPIGSRY